ncbi:MAG: response regulator [Candidatus Pacebacteria bacterium]|nr:response regulator [Candidatus Paceibacterota bacterium]
MNNKSILIIDDDLIFCDMLGEVLRAEGAVVSVAHDGVQGVSVANATRPDIIVCDYMMPVMHGTEVLEAVRSTTWGGEVPFVLLTNMGQPEILPQGSEKYSLCLLKTDWTLDQLAGKITEILADNGSSLVS